MKFNFKTQHTAQLRNHEGAKAWKMSSEMELYTAVVTSLLEANFYEAASERMTRLRQLVQEVDPRFTAQLAVYAREQMHLRSVPLYLAVELAAVHNGDTLVSRTVNRIIRRADEIAELLAAYAQANQRTGTKQLNKLSAQMRKGLASAFNRFEEYHFAKYDRQAAVTLRDALFLVHPRPKSKAQQALFDKIAKGTLETPYTWETQLSQTGQAEFKSEEEKAAAKRATWTEMVQSGKMGYMALLRNLRNLLEAGIDSETMQMAADRIAHEKQVLRSKQFPFRYLSAYRELRKLGGMDVGMVLEALEKAASIAADNIPAFAPHDRIFIAVDMSGSMQTPVSRMSTVQMFEVGLVLAMLMQSRNRRVEVGIFGESFKRITLPKGQVLRNADGLSRRIGEVGHSTNGYKVLKDLIRQRTVVDKVVVFTDMQLYNSTVYGGADMEKYWIQYKTQVAPEAKLYIVDLAGYGQSPLNLKQRDVFLLAGWNEKVFEVIDLIEKGESALAQIKSIEL